MPWPWTKPPKQHDCPVCHTPMEPFNDALLWYCAVCKHIYETTWQEVKAK